MARIIAIDYGKKRTGLAVTDPLKIIATGLETIESGALIPYLKKYFQQEEVELILIGYPLNMDDTPTDATPLVDKCIKDLKRVFPDMPLETIDERMTSKMASDAISGMGLRKKERQKKELIDLVAATMMLQEYLENHA